MMVGYYKGGGSGGECGEWWYGCGVGVEGECLIL